MELLVLHEFHASLGAKFLEVNGADVASDYGNIKSERAALAEKCGVLDLSFRSRVCLTGADRIRFLHGQVTNDVKRLRPGKGCYAALVTAKGRMQSDLNIYCLDEELLLDFEPGLTRDVIERLDKYIVADDVQVVDIATVYGLLSVQGPQARELVNCLGFFPQLPAEPFDFCKVDDLAFGEVFLVQNSRAGTQGFDFFVPNAALPMLAEKLIAVARGMGGCVCGWTALETARIEAGIPRFGVDMDESNFPQECGIEALAVSYTKGCYIGQEVLNRLHTMGHVNRELRGLLLSSELRALPVKGEKLYQGTKEAGYLTSVLVSERFHKNIGLGYVRREMSQLGTELSVHHASGESSAVVVELPFRFAAVNG